MYRNSKSIFLIILIVTSYLIPSTLVNADEQSSRSLLFSFQSYIDITSDNEPLKDYLKLDESTTVSLTIKYSTDIPQDFLKYMPWRLRNYILYGNMIAPQQIINLSILDEPDWMDISLASNQFSVNIPIWISKS